MKKKAPSCLGSSLIRDGFFYENMSHLLCFGKFSFVVAGCCVEVIYDEQMMCNNNLKNKL